MSRWLSRQLEAIMARDPALRTTTEALLCYPGLHAQLAHRIARRFYLRGWTTMARLVSHVARWLTGIEIHPGARLGEGVFIDHGMGVVIGETAVVGDDVTIYQGVTLGGTSLRREKRHPTIEEGAVIGAGASVLGDIVVGARAKIGAGSVVTKDVPTGCVVVGVPGRVAACEKRSLALDIREDAQIPDPVTQNLAYLQWRVEYLQEQVDALQRRTGVAHVPPPAASEGEDAAFSAGEGI